MKHTPIPTARRCAVRLARVLMAFQFVALSPAWAAAPDLEFHAPQAANDAKTSAAMRDLAQRMLPVYQDTDPDRYLENLSALQLVAGGYSAADVSRQALRIRRRPVRVGQPVGRSVVFDIYAYAKAIEAENRVSFSQAFTRAFGEVVSRLDDPDAYAVTRWLQTAPQVFQAALQRALDQQRAKDSIDQSDAVKLIRTYLSFDAYRSFGPLVDALVATDDDRRYAVESEILIKASDGASIAAVVARPKSRSEPLATLLEVTIGDSQGSAKECAAHGYVGVMAHTGGTRANPRHVVPYEHDGEDARAVIEWVVKQPWSDGRVAMYGDGYGAFTSWAAAARLPPALKAIATSGSTAPGIDVPMAGSIFHNSAYRWSLTVSTTDAAVEKDLNDDEPWRALDQKWYRSGRRYRDLGRLYGHPDPLFIRWLNHPSYDVFWQKMIPYREQFAKINIPVLTATGYFAATEPGALYYFTQHTRYNPHADHTLVIGPYEDGVMRRPPPAVLHGYEVDSAARVDVHELQYQWFDHVLKGAAPPALLSDRINYEVMGANEWRHAPSLEAMSGRSLRFYLDATASGGRRRLARHKSAKAAFVSQTVNFADRSDAGWMPPADLVTQSPVTHNDIMYVSEPLTQPMEFNGVFLGRLDFAVNKMDMDLNITLYERLAGGDFIRLFNPAYEFRASYARDRVHRHLLKAGERQELGFKSEWLTSRQLQKGSRLVMVLGINKRPDREINYGTGTDVSEESIADGKIPLKIRWYNDSYIEIPVRK